MFNRTKNALKNAIKIQKYFVSKNFFIKAILSRFCKYSVFFGENFDFWFLN